MKYVNKGNLIALLFVAAFTGDIALADSVIAKPGKAELLEDVRAGIDLRKEDFYQSIAKPVQTIAARQPREAQDRAKSIYFYVEPKGKSEGPGF